MDELTERVLAYQETGRGMDRLLVYTADMIYDFSCQILHWDDEQSSRFYNDFYPRLVRMFSQYRDKGVPFVGYLTKNLRWFSRNYIRWNRREGWKIAILTREAILTYEKLEDPHPAPDESLHLDESPVYGPEPCRSAVFYMALLQHDKLGEAGLKELSLRAGIPDKRLRMILESLREKMENRRKRYNNLISRRNNLYCALLHLQYRCREVLPAEDRALLQNRENEIRRRLVRIRYRINHSTWKPTHRELAEVLNVPRATVSSSIHKFKKRTESLFPERISC